MYQILKSFKSGQMNICIVGPAYPLRGGIAKFNELLCKAFISQGHHASIISYSLQYPGLLFPGKTQYVESGDQPDIEIYNLINSINPWTWWKTARFIRQLKPDVVLLRYWIPFMAPALGTIARLLIGKNIQIIALTDNLIPHEHRPGDKLLNTFFTKPIEKYLVMSESVKNDVLATKANASTMLLRHPIFDNYGDKIPRSVARKALGIAPNEKVILFFGLIREYKGLDLLIQAIPLLEMREEIKIVIAGEFYENAETYQSIIQKLGVQSNILMLDRYIADDEVAGLFSASDILALPYKTATQSGVTQIAFHFEIPVLVTAVGGLGEIILHEKSGYVCNPDPKEIAHYLNKFFKEEKAEQFSRMMAEEKEKYSWNAFCNAIVQFAGEKGHTP